MENIFKDCCLKPERWYCECPSPEPEPVDASSRVTAMAVVPSYYIGDTMTTYGERYGTACVEHNDKMYSLFGKPGEKVDKNGWVYIHDLNTNTLVDIKTIPNVCHGNGFCWDDKRKQFIIAPVFNAYSSDAGRNYTLTICNEDFTEVRSLYIMDENNIPINAMSVAYDYVNEKTYVYAYSGHTIYEYTGLGTLIKVSNVNYDAHGYDMNQGFAVRDGIFYLSSPKGNIIIGDVRTGTVLGEKVVDSLDSQKFRYLGELEDFEFNKDGILYTMRTLAAMANKEIEKDKDGKVTKINVKGFYINAVVATAVKDQVFPPYGTTDKWSRYNESYVLGNHTYYLDSSNDFWISYNHVRRPEQIDTYVVCNDGAQGIALNITGTHNIGSFIVTRPMEIRLGANCKLNVGRIYVYNDLVVSITDNSAVVNFTESTDHFYCTHLGNVTLAADDNHKFICTIPGDQLQIGVGLHYALTRIRTVPSINGEESNNVKIGSATYEDCRGSYLGSSKIMTTGQANGKLNPVKVGEA